MQQAQSLFSYKRLTELHTLHAIHMLYSHTLSKNSALPLYFCCYFTIAFLQKQQLTVKCLLKPLFSLISATRLWKKKSLCHWQTLKSLKTWLIQNTEHFPMTFLPQKMQKDTTIKLFTYKELICKVLVTVTNLIKWLNLAQVSRSALGHLWLPVLFSVYTGTTNDT